MSNSDSLLFDRESYIEKVETVQTLDGLKTVKFRAYRGIPYVSRPVDEDFQSLDIYEPVEIDGKPVDSSRSPILMTIGVGGYLSSRNKGRPAMPELGPDGKPMPVMPEPDTLLTKVGAPPRPIYPKNGGKPVYVGVAPGDTRGLAAANSFVVVAPGCRGRDNKAPDGTFYGKAPAALVDLKAAVRYLRHNRGLIPGDTERIFTTGGSAGGGLSLLMAVSGNTPLLDSWLEEIGAAKERDDIFGACALSPVTDLEHCDGAYEWEYGEVEGFDGELVDQTLSGMLVRLYQDWQNGLKLMGRGGYGVLTAENMKDYLLKTYLKPEAERFLKAKADHERQEYLDSNPWLKWNGDEANFSFEDFARHCGRMKGVPAFDDFEMKQAEPNEFGSKTVDSRHFTNFSLRRTAGSKAAEVEPEVMELLNLMNPAFYTEKGGCDMANNYWILHGACDVHTAIPTVTNIADRLAAMDKNVMMRLVWDGVHCSDDDPMGFIRWMKDLAAR